MASASTRLSIEPLRSSSPARPRASDPRRQAAAAALAAVTLARVGVARADLAAGLVAKIDVAATYFVDPDGTHGGATDIAFTTDGRAVVTTKDGTIFVRRSGGNLVTIAATVFGVVDSTSEKGLLGVVADPTAANAFFFYVSNGTADDDKHRVVHATLDANNTLTVDLANPIVAAARGLGAGLWGPANHDGGGLSISGGHLFIGVGDTGHNASPPTNRYASCLNLGNAKVLRVNLDGTIPTDNPFANVTTNVTGCDPENVDNVLGPWQAALPDRRIYAWGFRNPWRFWVDPHTGLMWVGDVGESTKEEIDVGGGDQHYGYPFFEGDTDWRGMNGITSGPTSCEQETPSRPCTPPVYAYTHDIGSTVVGGLIPEGCGWLGVFGGKSDYLFADYGAGWVRSFEVTTDRTGIVSPTPADFAQYGGGPVSFRMGPDGALYIVFNASSVVYQFTPHALTGSDCAGSGVDAGVSDAGTMDAGATDSGGATEAGSMDAGALDAADEGGAALDAAIDVAASGGTTGTGGDAGGGGGGNSGGGGATGAGGDNAGAGGAGGSAGSLGAAGSSGSSGGGVAGNEGGSSGGGAAGSSGSGGNGGADDRGGAGGFAAGGAAGHASGSAIGHVGRAGGTATAFSRPGGCGCTFADGGPSDRKSETLIFVALFGLAGASLRRRRARRTRAPERRTDRHASNDV